MCRRTSAWIASRRAVHPSQDVHVLRCLAVLAERPHPRSRLRIRRHERARVAGGTEILAWVEAERRSGSDGAGALALALGPVCLAGVLDDGDPVGVSHRSQCTHVGHLPVEVHRHHGMRPDPDRCRRRAGIEAVVTLRDIDDDRNSAGLGHRLECRDERRWPGR